MLDKRLTKIFCDICIKEILKCNKPGTHFAKDGWLKIMANFEKEAWWNLIKRTVDASNDWWESRLKLNNDKTWTPSSGTLRSEFFEDVDNDIPKENKEENTRNDVYILNDVHIDGNNKKIKTLEISSSHFKTGSKKSSKQIEEAAKCP
ncbi:hypothetical protein Goklo_013848, partial [Gossypium klotzschianum]|nr:hypothetical protein [Gossypium klotzschianum]